MSDHPNETNADKKPNDGEKVLHPGKSGTQPYEPVYPGHKAPESEENPAPVDEDGEPVDDNPSA